MGPPQPGGLLPQFADSFAFTRRGWAAPLEWLRKIKHQFYVRRLGRILNDPRVRWVSNHNVNACWELVALGVGAGKVVPWDWPSMVRPAEYEPKSLVVGRPWDLVFVGALDEAKGVGDAIAAAAKSAGAAGPFRLRVIGRGDPEPFRRQAAALGVAGSVEAAGLLPHAKGCRRPCGTPTCAGPQPARLPGGPALDDLRIAGGADAAW